MNRNLTDLEGILLSSIWRDQPCSFYWLKKLMDSSPAGGNRDSAGSIYPAVNRLIKCGFVTKTAVKTDGRGTNMLHCTATGYQKIREWVIDLRASECFPVDPLRARTFFLGALDKHERREWAVAAKKVCMEQLELIDQFEQMAGEKADAYSDFGHGLARSVVMARLKALKNSPK